jgi:hypothetical protein
MSIVDGLAISSVMLTKASAFERYDPRSKIRPIRMGLAGPSWKNGLAAIFSAPFPLELV